MLSGEGCACVTFAGFGVLGGFWVSDLFFWPCIFKIFQAEWTNVVARVRASVSTGVKMLLVAASAADRKTAEQSFSRIKVPRGVIQSTCRP